MKKETTTMQNLDELTPREIDELLFSARARSEDAIIAASGLGAMLDESTQLKAELRSLIRRQKKLNEELESVRAHRRDLDARSRPALLQALDAGVDVKRLIELTGRDYSWFAKLRREAAATLPPEL
jgi:predicted transcriptional regulator